MSISYPSAKSEWTPLRLIESELKLVEETLYATLASPVGTIDAVTRHLVGAGGKRLRPSLVILSAYASDKPVDIDTMIKLAAGVELIHMATLVHDDVIDGAEIRRGRPTANTHWGNHVSVLTGDYMLAKSFFLLSGHGDMRIMQAVAQATIAMAEGEINQIEAVHDFRTQTDQYISTIKNKTAEFMSACCRIGTILASTPNEIENALADYGLNLGIAFQITDDILDLAGDPARTGKPIGGDLREGKLTLPVIITMMRASSTDRIAIEKILSDSNNSMEDVEFVLRLAQQLGAIEEASLVASDFIKTAVSSLQQLPASDARDSLEQLAHNILHRDH